MSRVIIAIITATAPYSICALVAKVLLIQLRTYYKVEKGILKKESEALNH